MVYPQTFEEKIGMKDIRAMLRGHCLSALGEQRVEEMTFAADAALLQELHQQVGEFVRMEEETDGLYIQDIMRGGVTNDDPRIPRNLSE